MLLTSLLSMAMCATALSADSVPTAEIDSMPDINRDLEDLVVVAKKELVKSDGSKLTYNMGEDESSKTDCLLDALRKVPMVTVDGQDNIYINGSQNFKIYVNGKSDPMFSANYKQIFKAMPASSVSKIEVITEPGAKFDAEGTGGILNLVFEQKQKHEGYSGSLSGSLTNRNYHINGYGATKYRNVNFDASVTYMNTLKPQKQISSDETINFTDNPVHRQTKEQIQTHKFNYVDGNLNFSWEPNENNLFTLGGNIMSMKVNVGEMNAVHESFSASNALLSTTVQNMTGYMKQFNVSANTSYQHTFSKKSHNLIVSYQYNFGRNPFDLFSTNTSLQPVYYEGRIENDLRDVSYASNLMSSYIRENTAQVDYSLPFGRDDNQLFEAGGKMILRHNSNYSFTKAGLSPENMVQIDSNSDMINQNQNVYSIYGSYTGTFGKWSAKGGVRYEHTDMGMEYIRESRKFWSSLNDVVPNASLSYIFGPASNLRFGYQMRISRPSLNQVSPYQMNIVENYVQTGNPDLKSEKINIISLRYTNFSRILGGNIGIGYYQTDNAIENYSTWKDGTQYSSYANAGLRRIMNLDGFLMINATQKLSFNIYGVLTYTDIQAKTLGLKNSGWGGNYNVGANYTAPGDVKFSAYGGQNVHMVHLQGYYSGWYYYGLSISRDFLKDKKLNVGINASNFFTKNNVFKAYTKTNEFQSSSKFLNENWRVGLSVTWRFGNSETKTKKTAKSINNDDASSVGKSQNGGGSGI